MLTEAMTWFLCEKVLGWEPWGDGRWYCHNPGRGRRALRRTPDFTTWEGFGLLLTALAKDNKRPAIWHNSDGWNVEVEAQWNVAVEEPRLTSRDDPRVALALAAAQAYGYKEE